MIYKMILALLIIAALAAGGLFFKDSRELSAAADTLETQIKKTSSQAVTVSISNKTLETEIAEINKNTARALSELENTRQKIPLKGNSNKIVEDILFLGMQKRVNVIPLSTQDWNAVKIKQNEYQVFRITIKVEGLQGNVVDFIDGLQNLEHQPLVIDSISLDKTSSLGILPGLSVTPALIPFNMPAATPPNLSISTNPASDIGVDKATMNGYLLTPGTGFTASVSFEYGRSAQYGSSTQPVLMITSNPFSATKENLDQGAVYHFRAKAVTDTAGTIYGADRIFRTLVDSTASVSISIYAR